jgi:gamma-glutamyltranspeptidase/glutathione hydrolase
VRSVAQPRPGFVFKIIEMTARNTLSVILAAILQGGCATISFFPDSIPDANTGAPERASGYAEKFGPTARKFMISAANPLAADAGYQVLRSGGSAVDAAIATQMVLTLVEPQSSGIGGGAFLMHFDGHAVQAFDGRETAPATANEQLFQTAEGKLISFFDAAVGGRSVGAPGVLRMLELAHKWHGRLPWSSLFGPAIKLADDGFGISPRLHALLESDAYLKADASAAAYFFDGSGKPWPVGHLLKNPELARVFREIADGGANVFYGGQIAQEIEVKVKGHPTNPGGLTAADIAAYEAKVREPICSDYKAWTVCGMPPPSSGGIAIAQMLGMLELKGLQQFAPKDGSLNAKAVHLFSEAGRLAFADRERYVADTDFVPLPGNSMSPLLDKKYLAERAALIGKKSMGSAKFGIPPGMAIAWGLNYSPELESTSHMSIVDDAGNAVSMTTTIENAFGSRMMVRGFLLNNELTDFSFKASDDDGPIANRVQAGKRPRSNMAPTFVFERGTKNLVLIIGSPGGSAIINYVAKALVGTMDWGLSVEQAINLPNFGSRNGPTELEQGRTSESLVSELKAMGHSVRLMDQTSGLQGIIRINVDGNRFWLGGADPRREGIAKGD